MLVFISEIIIVFKFEDFVSMGLTLIMTPVELEFDSKYLFFHFILSPTSQTRKSPIYMQLADRKKDQMRQYKSLSNIWLI